MLDRWQWDFVDGPVQVVGNRFLQLLFFYYLDREIIARCLLFHETRCLIIPAPFVH